MGKSLETLLSNKKSSSQFLREREEKERKNLQKMIMSGDQDKGKQDDKPDEDDGPPKVNLNLTFSIGLLRDTMPHVEIQLMIHGAKHLFKWNHVRFFHLLRQMRVQNYIKLNFCNILPQ